MLYIFVFIYLEYCVIRIGGSERENANNQSRQLRRFRNPSRHSSLYFKCNERTVQRIYTKYTYADRSTACYYQATVTLADAVTTLRVSPVNIYDHPKSSLYTRRIKMYSFFLSFSFSFWFSFFFYESIHRNMFYYKQSFIYLISRILIYITWYSNII